MDVVKSVPESLYKLPGQISNQQIILVLADLLDLSHIYCLLDG